ncbi:MAG TPA: TetR/AcrR family transcriptional regulator [Micromonosporaceae bacterium]|nr:TetR/AcrR family transcriptional regulator [Micromonosporaceae bacterium]
MADVAVVDRRVRRTRRNLGEALIALIVERGYDRITVQDILDRADVGRSTFYAHFRDKDALLVSSFDELRDDLRRDMDALTPGELPDDPAHPVSVVFQHAYDHRPIYRALCGRQGGNVVDGHLRSMFGALLGDHLRPHLAAAGSSLPPAIVAEFYASALIGVLTWWVNEDFPHSPNEVAAAYGALAAPGIMAAIGAEAPDKNGSAGVRVQRHARHVDAQPEHGTGLRLDARR